MPIRKKFFLHLFKTKKINFVKFMDTKKVRRVIFPLPLFVGGVVGSGILEPRSGMEKLGSGINIPNPQHWMTSDKKMRELKM